MSYIYKITNKINNKVYIGKTSLSSIEQRFQEHINDSKKIRYEKRPLYDAFQKYGIENFSIEQIQDKLTDEQACQQEIYWIKYFNSYVGFNNSNGYNATLGGDGQTKYNYKEISSKYLELQNQETTARLFNCDVNTVRTACRENNIEIISSGEVTARQRRKKIERIDEKGRTKTYNSISEAAYDFPNKATETARKNISRALNNNATAYGFIWKYI